MTIRDYVSKAGEKFKSYFSRGSSDDIPSSGAVNQDERGRNAQIGYLQKQTWFDKFINGTGKVLKYLGIGTAIATGVGGVALGVQYVRGGWPYKEVPKNEYVITQNAINEKPATPLKQGVNFFPTPFVRTVKDANGLEEKVTGQIQTSETPMFEYRSNEGLKVKLKTQFNYQVTKPEGAGKVYWDYGGLEKAIESLDNVIENVLMNELSKVKAENIASEHRFASVGETIYKDGEKIKAKGGEEVNYLIEAENKANELLRKERSGISVTNFSISEPIFSQRIEAAWEEPMVAANEAHARITRAEAEAKEAQIQATATAQAITERYFPIGEAIAKAAGQPQLAAQYTMQLVMADNNQQMVNTASQNKGRLVFAPGLFGGNYTPQPGVTIQNVGQASKAA